MTQSISQIIGDPSLRFQMKVDGEMETLYYDIFYERELNLEFRNFENQDSLSRVVRVRILTYRDDTILKQVRFEILDDSDLYFFDESIFDESSFEQLKEEVQLLIDFEVFPEEIRNLLDESQSSESENQITFVEENDGSGTLEVLQLLELKAVEILKIRFEPSNPEFVQSQVQYRFNQMSAILSKNKAILSEFNKQMQSKNPILLKSINSPSTSMRTTKRSLKK